ncbi:hypothetical protein PsorP6_015284 [Peronosclerospora sorghi]|uniref:Uncharacterized protein n=1 Tax=Peronosclerospora sorghi TaxID=230839 RepID=A0ACC0VS85_9STRA|nr:hypothetical protein PsorP6_015284 [Peronosclerospora sorghi]
MDHAVMNMIEKERGEYGKQRLFGAIGWGTGAYITGLVVAAAGISWAFRISLLFMFISLLVLHTIPLVKHDHDRDQHSAIKGKATSVRHAGVGEKMRRIFEKKDLIMLLLVVFFMGLMYGVLSSFLALNLFNLSGKNAQIVGIAIMCETMSELPAFFFSHVIIKKLGAVKVLLVSIVAYALRITYYAIMTNAWGAIPFEFLHGCTFGLAWAVCTQYVYAAAPKGAEGTVMGLLNATQNGMARAVGTIIGGYFYQLYGARVMWAVTDLGVPLALIFLSVFAYFRSELEECTNEGLTRTHKANLKSRLRARSGVTANTSWYDLKRWYEKMRAIPIDNDTCFVAKDDSDEVTTFRFSLTTRRLLDTAASADCQHAEATYKLVSQGLPF